MPRYHRVTFDGTLALGAERWSTSVGVRATSETQPSATALTDWANAIMGLFNGTTGGITALKSFYSSSGTLTRVRIYSYPDIGQAADVLGQSTASAVAGSGTPTMPPQCSIVISLNTGFPGARNRGRMYWPLVGGAVTTGQQTSLVSQSVVTNIAGAFDAMLNLSGGSAGRLAVVSESAATVTDVTSISLDTVVDTQRRRRDGMVGTKYTAALT